MFLCFSVSRIVFPVRVREFGVETVVVECEEGIVLILTSLDEELVLELFEFDGITSVGINQVLFGSVATQCAGP